MIGLLIALIRRLIELTKIFTVLICTAIILTNIRNIEARRMVIMIFISICRWETIGQIERQPENYLYPFY